MQAFPTSRHWRCDSIFSCKFLTHLTYSLILRSRNAFFSKYRVVHNFFQLTGNVTFIISNFYLPTVHFWVSIVTVHFSHSVMSDCSHTRPPCPSPTLRAYSNSCPSSWWCHPAISSCVIPFSFCLQSFLVSGSFQRSRFFTSGHQSFRASDSASVLPMNIQDWFVLGLNGLISLQSKGLSRVFSNITVQKHQFFDTQLSFWSNPHLYMTTGKTITLTRQTFVGNILLFNTLSTLVITFLPRSKRLLISNGCSHHLQWFWSPRK